MADSGLGLSLDGGTLRRISPNASREEQISMLNEVIEKLNLLLKTQVFADGGSKRVLNGFYEGRWPGGDIGIAVSKPGEDVTTADFADLVFAHDYTTNTQYWTDPVTGKNYMQVGTLPDDTGGLVIAKSGKDVADGFN